MIKGWWWTGRHVLGIAEHAVSWREQALATLLAGVGLWLVALLSEHFMRGLAAPSFWLVASMGASAVLVFAVPHGALSQPWAVIAGQGISAIAGLCVVHALGASVVAGTLAVALAIAAMHSLRCIHPPGGATALSVVMLADSGHMPDWSYVVNPVLLNATLLVLMAVLLNAPFSWRRYPVAWAFRKAGVIKGASLAPESPFTPRQLREAFAELGSMIDISDDELQVLYQALRRQQVHDELTGQDLQVGCYYSNGEVGERWSVRRIIDASEPGARRPQLIVKTVAGPGRGDIQVVLRQVFLSWGKYRVVPDGGAWRRLEDDE